MERTSNTTPMRFRWTTGGGCTRVHVLAPRGDNLGAVTSETRREADLAAVGGCITQVWTWRGGEAVVVCEWSPRGCERWVVVVRRGLRRACHSACRSDRALRRRPRWGPDRKRTR